MSRDLTAGIVAAVLLAAFGAAAGEQELAVYPKSIHTRIGNDLNVNGMYHRMAYFTTKDSPQTVARYFQKYFLTEGVPTTTEGDGKEEYVVAGFYSREGLQRTVVIRRHQDKTVGFTVLTDLWVEAPRKPPPAIVPLEGTLMSHDMASRDALTGSASRTAIVGKDVQSVRKELIVKYEADGFELRRELGQTVQGAQQFTLEFSRGKEDVLVHLNVMEANLTGVSTTAAISSAKDNAPNASARDAMRAPNTVKRDQKK